MTFRTLTEPMPLAFALIRREDVTGLSGTGHVADGVRWPDGTCVVRWRGTHATTTVYAGLPDVIALHLHGGKTHLRWDFLWPRGKSHDESARQSAFAHGWFDCVMDGNENAPFGSVGGKDKRGEMRAPESIQSKDECEYLAGYRASALQQYGVDWATITFSWGPALTLTKGQVTP